MAFSIESRVPFLTVPMANLLLSMPEEYLISNAGQTKHVFRAAMRGIVPNAVLNRRDKIGFATPERDWLLGAAPVMRQWLENGREVPFLDQRQLLGAFDRIIASKQALTRPIWRWVNYVRWYGLQSFDAASG
jgi:asparagine synthase (glutamine-hydrolysing)